MPDESYADLRRQLDGVTTARDHWKYVAKTAQAKRDEARRAKKSFKCPSCGHALRDRHDPHKLIDHLPIGGVRRAVMRVLLANFAREVSTSLIVDCVYAGTADGGPQTAMDGISVHAHELRKLIEPFGLTIRGRHGGKHCGGSTFRLDWSDAPALR